MNSYKSLFYLKILKSILITFVDSFLILFFLDVSNNNILPLGLYKIVTVTAIFLVMFFTRNLCKSKYRINLLRIGIVLSFIYFLLIILLKEKIIQHIYLLGLIYGLEEGFYYSVYNNIESDVVTNNERPKFIGSYTAIKSILAIIFPIVFGAVIYQTNFIKSLLIVLTIVLIQIFLSFMVKDKNIPKGHKTNLKKYFELVKTNQLIRKVYSNRFLAGLTYSEGAFSFIITIYIIKVFSTSLSLGIFTSIFSLVSYILAILFAKYIKKNQYKKVILFSMTCIILTLGIMIYSCNFVTIILFNFFQTFYKSIVNNINTISASDVSNLDDIKINYKVEYWLGTETALFLGRIISNTLFILMIFIDTNVMMYIFMFFLVIFTINSVILQCIVNKYYDKKIL